MAERTLYTFADGAAAQLVAVHIEASYRGLLEGLPRRKMNDRAVAGAADHAVRVLRPFDACPVHLVEPARRALANDGRFPDLGPPERLPAYAACALFTGPALDADRRGLVKSAMISCWWSDLAPSVELSGLADVASEIAWRDHAADLEL